MHRVVFAFLLLSITPVLAQQEDSLFIKRLTYEILTKGKAYENLRILCKTVGGRLAGTPQMYKAEEWGLKSLQSSGADKAYLQPCKVPRWVRGIQEQSYIQYRDGKGKVVKLPLNILALGNSIGTKKEGITAPVVLIKDFDDLEKNKDLVKGKIVFYNYPFNPSYIQTMQAYREAGVYRRSGPSKAAQYGAVGVVIRSMSQSQDNYAHTGTTTYDSSFPKIPCAALGLKDADKLSTLLSAGQKVNLFLRTQGHFLPDTIGHNVIGELRGNYFPEKIITVGGHLDSWDVAEGAHDDGAGCVHAMEVLRAFKALDYKPRHTIRVVLFANEENGLAGGNKYAEEAKTRNETHIFALESDAGGFTPRAFGFTVPEYQLEKVRSWLPLFVPLGVYEFIQGGGGSDIGPLNTSLNIPIASYIPDSQRYFDVHHARNDVFENVHKRELELGALNIAALIYLVDKYGL